MNQKLLATVALGASLLGGTAYADPVLVSGTATFKDTSSGNNGLSFTAPNTSFNLNLNVGTPDKVSDFFTISTTDTNKSGTVSDNIMETFTFTMPGVGGGTVGGTGTETTSNFFGLVSSDGTITWSSIAPITLSDGSELQISLADTNFGTNFLNGGNDKANVDATFVLLSGPSGSQGNGVDPVGVPEPASLALLGTGMAGLGVFRRRSKRPVA